MGICAVYGCKEETLGYMCVKHILEDIRNKDNKGEKKMSHSTKPYPEDLRKQTIAKVQGGMTLAQAALEACISVSTLARWCKIAGVKVERPKKYNKKKEPIPSGKDTSKDPLPEKIAPTYERPNLIRTMISQIEKQIQKYQAAKEALENLLESDPYNG